MGLHPVVDLGLSQTQNILGGVRRVFAATDIQEVQASGGLVQGLLVTSGIAEETADLLLNQGSGLGIVLLLADDLLHGDNLLSKFVLNYMAIIHIFWNNARGFLKKSNILTDICLSGWYLTCQTW